MNFENEYIKDMNSSAPDMDSLWEKINAADTEDDDISAFVSAANECKSVSTRSRQRKMLGSAAAAVLIVCISAMALSQDSDIANETDNRYSMAEENEISNDCDDMDYDGCPTDEWVYSADTSEIYEYESLSLADTPSGIYTALSANTEDVEYFVEADVLKKTELFIDCVILASGQTDGMTIEYSVQVIHIIGGEVYDENITVISHSPYELRINREYLLPVYIENDVYVLSYDNAPQIELTQDRELIFHNGWSSLSSEGHSISYPQIYADDYFYDRMNIAAEASLEKLFESWERLR